MPLCKHYLFAVFFILFLFITEKPRKIYIISLNFLPLLYKSIKQKAKMLSYKFFFLQMSICVTTMQNQVSVITSQKKKKRAFFVLNYSWPQKLFLLLNIKKKTLKILNLFSLWESHKSNF